MSVGIQKITYLVYLIVENNISLKTIARLEGNFNKDSHLNEELFLIGEKKNVIHRVRKRLKNNFQFYSFPIH